MFIPDEFDEANQEARKRITNNALRTAQKLNLRIVNFLNDIQENYSIKDSDKKLIKERLLDNLK